MSDVPFVFKTSHRDEHSLLRIYNFKDNLSTKRNEHNNTLR